MDELDAGGRWLTYLEIEKILSDAYEKGRADANEWNPVEKSERAEICISYYVPEIGDDACHYYEAMIDSSGFDLDTYAYSLPDGYAIFKLVEPQEPTL